LDAKPCKTSLTNNCPKNNQQKKQLLAGFP